MMNKKKYIIDIGITFTGSCLGIYTLIEIASYIVPTEYLSAIKGFVISWYKCYIYISFALCITLIRIIIKFGRKQIVDEQISEESIIGILTEAQKKRKWHEIIELGKGVSDLFWYNSKKVLRVTVGEYMVVAAENSGEKELLAKTLVEEIGITNWSIGNVATGIKNIKKGLKLAEDNNYYYIMARACRHLTCLYIGEGKYIESKRYYDKGVEKAQFIAEGNKKLDAIASLKYAHARILLFQSRYKEAIDENKEAISLYNELLCESSENELFCYERKIKLHRLIGEIYSKSGLDNCIEKSYENYLESLKMAYKVHNNEEIFLNYINMSYIKYRSNKRSEASMYCDMAKNLLDLIESPNKKAKYLTLKSFIES